eukprot:scaffold53412_cov63-Phaeocystis_antarctica.AAC.1
MPLRLLPALPALTPALLCVFAEGLDDDAAGSATANAITRMAYSSLSVRINNNLGWDHGYFKYDME